MQLPADLGRRILEAARIALAMHQQMQEQPKQKSGGAGAAVTDHDGRISMDGTPPDARVR